MWYLPITTVFLTLFLHITAVAQAANSNCDIPLTDQFIQDIPEDWPVGSVLRHLHITGDENDISVYETIRDPHVAFDSVSRNLTLVQPLDVEDDSITNLQLTLQLNCLIKATDQTVAINIVILILDVNDNPPVFEQPEYRVSISELTQVGTTILSGISATDPDIYNIYVMYEIEEGPYSSFFDIPIPAQGAVEVKQRLDYEEVQQITITIIAKDFHSDVLGRPQASLNNSALVLITVLDGDDQNPVFIDPPYMARMEENFPLSQAVEVSPPILAVDGDHGINTAIFYAIVADVTTDESAYFAIDNATGGITLVRQGLRRNTVLTLQIKATQVDDAARFNTALLRVHVVASNSNPPYFTQPLYSASLVENVLIGTPVLKVTAMDNDQGALLIYSFEEDQSNKPFVINSDTGDIVTNAMLDYENTSQYNMTVEVTDGSYFGTCTVMVTVIDVNDHPPRFEQDSYHFNAAREAGRLLGQVMAVDGDTHSSVTYRLLEYTDLFSISSFGELSISGDPDALTQPAYKLVVVALDAGLPPFERSVIVDILFDDVSVGASVDSSEDNEVDVVLIIILGIICGILLVVVIILLVYIYRNNMLTDKEHRMRAIQTMYQTESVSRTRYNCQTFERRFNMQQQTKEAQERSYADDPKMIQYKQNAAHHLALYNHIHAEDDSNSTRPQENPFILDDSYDATYANMDMNCNPAFASDAQSLAPSLAPAARDTLRRNMHTVHEIEYETAVAPFDHGTDDSSTDSLQSSTPSVSGSVNTYLTGGSTQNLVTPKGTLRKKSSVSFIDSGSHVDDYQGSQNSGRDPRMTLTPPDDKPGITVYY